MSKRSFGKLLVLALCTVMLLVTADCAFAEALDPEHFKSQYIALVEPDTGLVLFEKNGSAQAYPASTTKIMTGLLVLENMTRDDLQQLITVGEEVRAFSSANSLLPEHENEEIRGVDALYAMLLFSANDCAATLAIHLGGSLEGFANMMNAKAKDLGLENTHFVNPHGIHDENHYTTALDMAKLASYATKNERFMSVVGSGSYICPPTNKRGDEKEIFSTNRFLTDNPKSIQYNWSPVTGMKTGSTRAAQGCLVTTAEKDGKKLVCVVLGDPSKDYNGRWTESKELLEWGFDNLDTFQLSTVSFGSVDVQIKNASRNDPDGGKVSAGINPGELTISMLKDDIQKIINDPSIVNVVTNVDEKLSAPISAGQKIGTASLNYGANTLAVVDITSPRDVSSIEADPVNPVDTLIKNVAGPVKKNYTWIIVIVALLLLVVAALALVLIRSRRRIRRARKRNIYRAAGGPVRRNSYYDYKRK